MMKQIKPHIQSYIDNRSILGTAVAILQDGKVLFEGGFGMTSVEENGVPVTNHTLFAYGSIAKNVCALLIMRLVEQQLLELDTPILQYLPSLQFSNQDYGRRITLRHLLSHTSGLPAAGKDFGPRDRDSLRRFVYEQIPSYTFLAEPGSVHLYSSTVFCIAGHIAEVVTNKWYDDIVDELVFKPLEMNRTTFDPAVALTYPIALPHEEGSDGEPNITRQMFYNVSGHPSGFGYTCVSDLAKLAQMYLNNGKNGEQQFLKPSSVAEMQKMEKSRHIESTINPQGYSYLGYGLGFEVGRYRHKLTVGHGGMQLSYNCFFKLFPNEQSGIIILTNFAEDGPLWQMVTSLYDRIHNLPMPEDVYLDAFRPKSISLNKPVLRRYEGAFLSVEEADLVRFYVDNNQLMFQRKDEDSIGLDAVGDKQFCAEISSRYLLPIEFVNNLHGEITHVMIGGEPYFPIDLDTEFETPPQSWKAFAGVYKDPTNSNLDELFSVRLQKDTLWIAEGTHEVEAYALGKNCFVSEIGLIEFEESPHDDAKWLVWGKAVRCFRLDEERYRSDGVIHYVVDVPYQIG